MIRITSSKDRLHFEAPDGPVAVYHFGEQWARPFFLPVYAPGERILTRGWPVEPGPGETEDHPHHKGLWVAHGDVDGIDNWGEGAGHGRTVHLGFDLVESDRHGARFVERNEWTDSRGTAHLRERRSVAWRRDDRDRILDLRLEFEPAGGKEVVFGDTKEGGLISVRVATSMDAARNGRIENADGLVFERGKGEEVTWGKRSRWVDYSGPVDGETWGVAILDHPANPVHPTWWHVRGYGLFTANPFGTAAFEPESGLRGDLRLEPGGRLEFRYRLIVHPGDASRGGIEDRWREFSGR